MAVTMSCRASIASARVRRASRAGPQGRKKERESASAGYRTWPLSPLRARPNLPLAESAADHRDRLLRSGQRSRNCRNSTANRVCRVRAADPGDRCGAASFPAAFLSQGRPPSPESCRGRYAGSRNPNRCRPSPKEGSGLAQNIAGMARKGHRPANRPSNPRMPPTSGSHGGIENSRYSRVRARPPPGQSRKIGPRSELAINTSAISPSLIIPLAPGRKRNAFRARRPRRHVAGRGVGHVLQPDQLEAPRTASCPGSRCRSSARPY